MPAHHERRRRLCRIKVRDSYVTVPKRPTIKSMMAEFERAYVETGICSLGTTITQLKQEVKVDGDGGYILGQRDMSGRLLEARATLTSRLNRARNMDLLASVPPFRTMALSEVDACLTRLHQPTDEKDESETEKRDRAHRQLLVSRSERTDPSEPVQGRKCWHMRHGYWCPDCRRSKVAAGCACGVQAEWCCIGCQLQGRCGLAELEEDLEARGEELDDPMEDQEEGVDEVEAERLRLLERAALLDHADFVTERLLEIGEARQMPGEDERGRETRLAWHQNFIMLSIWADDSPIAKKTIQLHLLAVLLDHLAYRNCGEAQLACSRPSLHVIIAVGATLTDLRFVQENVTLDLQSLHRDPLVMDDGTEVGTSTRAGTGDAPIHGHLFGTCSSGGGHCKCANCEQRVSRYTDLTEAALGTALRTLQATDELARRVCGVTGFETHTDLRKATKAQVYNLIRTLAPAVPRDGLLKPELVKKALGLTRHITHRPAILEGLQSFGSAVGFSLLESWYDIPLHGLTGVIKQMRPLLKAKLSKSDRETFTTLETQVLGDKSHYDGALSRRWLAAVPWMLRRLNLSSLNRDLQQALEYLAQAVVLGFRASYAEWWNDQSGMVMTFMALIFKCNHHLLKVLPCKTKVGKDGLVRPLAMFMTYYHQCFMHAMQFYQFVPLMLMGCEANEQKFRPYRNMSTNTSNNHTQHMMTNTVIRDQMEAIVKDEHMGEKGVRSDRQLQLDYKQSFPRPTPTQQEFGPAFWKEDPNWESYVFNMSPYLVDQNCWCVEENDDDELQLVVLLDVRVSTSRLHFRNAGLPDVVERAESSYEELKQMLQGMRGDDRRVLLREGLAAHAAGKATTTRVPKVATTRTDAMEVEEGDGVEEEYESDEEESDEEESDEEESDEEESDEEESDGEESDEEDESEWEGSGDEETGRAEEGAAPMSGAKAVGKRQCVVALAAFTRLDASSPNTCHLQQADTHPLLRQLRLLSQLLHVFLQRYPLVDCLTLHVDTVNNPCAEVAYCKLGFEPHPNQPPGHLVLRDAKLAALRGGESRLKANPATARLTCSPALKTGALFKMAVDLCAANLPEHRPEYRPGCRGAPPPRTAAELALALLTDTEEVGVPPAEVEVLVALIPRKDMPTTPKAPKAPKGPTWSVTERTYEGEELGGNTRRGFGVTLMIETRSSDGETRSCTYAGGHSINEGVETRDGHGLEQWECGVWRKGEWKSDMQHGLGARGAYDGSIVEGSFMWGDMHGQGEFYSSSANEMPDTYGLLMESGRGTAAALQAGTRPTRNTPEFNDKLDAALECADSAAIRGKKAAVESRARRRLLEENGGCNGGGNGGGGSSSNSNGDGSGRRSESADAKLFRQALSPEQGELVDEFEKCRSKHAAVEQKTDKRQAAALFEALGKARHNVLHEIALYSAELRVIVDRHAAEQGVRTGEVSSVITEKVELDRILLAQKLQERVASARNLDLKKYAVNHANAVERGRAWDVAGMLEWCSTLKAYKPAPPPTPALTGSRGMRMNGGKGKAIPVLQENEQLLKDRAVLAARKRLKELEEDAEQNRKKLARN